MDTQTTETTERITRSLAGFLIEPRMNRFGPTVTMGELQVVKRIIENDPLTERIIGAAIEVHRHLGPGVLESVFEECLCYELAVSNLAVKRQVPLPVVYKGLRMELGFRPDLVVSDTVVVELKCVEKLLPVHDAQLLTYLRLSGLHTGLLINFQSQPLRNGIKRMVI